MPVTSVDIPEKEMRILDRLKSEGLIRHKKDAIATAVHFYRVLELHLWVPPVLRAGGQRALLMTEEGVRSLSSGISEEELKRIGLDIGRTFQKHFLIAANVDLASRQNWPTFLDFLRNLGWGSFTMEENRIVVTQAGLPLAIAEGCLQGALGVPLAKVTGNLQMAILEVRQEV